MTNRRFLLLTLCLFVSACANATATATNDGGGELEDIVEVVREIDPAQSSDEGNGWRKPSIHWSDFDLATLEIEDPTAQFVIAEGESYGPGDQMIYSILPLGTCDSDCLETAEVFAELSATASAGFDPLDELYSSRCGNCASNFISLIEVDGASASSVDAERALELLQPIDTDLKVSLTFGPYWFIRTTDAGWDVLERFEGECTDEDTDFVLSHVSLSGEAVELERLVVPGTTEGGVVCN